MEKKLVVNIIQKSFEDNQNVLVHEGLKLELLDGEFACLLGPNGVGKTTLLKMIAGLDTNYDGNIFHTQNPGEALGDCRLNFQEPRLLPWLTVEQNISFALNSSSESQMNLVKQLVNNLGLEKYTDFYPEELSGGLKQKVALARSLAAIPRLLLLDEPFSSLDRSTRLRMQEEILKTTQENNTAVLMVTHDLEEAVYLADKIFIMSPRPSRVVKTLEIKLAKPRNRASKEFIEYYVKAIKSLDETVNIRKQE